MPILDSELSTDSPKSRAEDLLHYLKDAGLDRTRIVKAEIVVTEHDNKPAFDEAWATWMPDNYGPVRSFVESAMPEGDLIEIIITAAL